MEMATAKLNAIKMSKVLDKKVIQTFNKFIIQI